MCVCVGVRMEWEGKRWGMVLFDEDERADDDIVGGGWQVSESLRGDMREAVEGERGVQVDEQLDTVRQK